MQGVLIIIIKNHVAKMLCLPKIRITKLIAMRSREAMYLCLQTTPLSAFVQKKGWRVFQLKGKYVAKLFALIQAI